MHFGNAYIFQRKMFSIHFPKENVQRTFSKGKCSAVQKCCVFCFAKNKDAVQKCIFASHFVLQKCIFASTKCYKCILATHHIFQRKMFSCAKMLCFLLCKKQRCCAKMHFCITFCFAKMHFCINKMLQMHLMPKCI